MYIDINNSNKKFDIIYTDPPWPINKTKRSARPKQKINLVYPTMLMTDIKSMHDRIISKNAKEKHNVFMWCVESMLIQTEKMMKDLGYKLHIRFIWDKQNGIAPAFTVRFSHEYLLWFYKPGHIVRPNRDKQGKYTTVMREPSREHSKKPDAAYLMLEDMFAGCDMLELFARNTRDGWHSWGNEIDKLQNTQIKLI